MVFNLAKRGCLRTLPLKVIIAPLHTVPTRQKAIAYGLPLTVPCGRSARHQLVDAAGCSRARVGNTAAGAAAGTAGGHTIAAAGAAGGHTTAASKAAAALCSTIACRRTCQTASMTPNVSMSSAVSSEREGYRPSTAIASTHVTTGIALLWQAAGELRGGCMGSECSGWVDPGTRHKSSSST